MHRRPPRPSPEALAARLMLLERVTPRPAEPFRPGDRIDLPTWALCALDAARDPHNRIDRDALGATIIMVMHSPSADEAASIFMAWLADHGGPSAYGYLSNKGADPDLAPPWTPERVAAHVLAALAADWPDPPAA